MRDARPKIFANEANETNQLERNVP
jgi:hypothetical protein